MKSRILLLLLALSVTLASNAVNYFGDVYRLKQPDGSSIEVKVFGNEFYQDVETIDGYTLIRDEKTKEICYALLASNGKEYASSGIKYRGGDTPKSISLLTKPHIRITPESIREKETERKLKLGFDESKQLSPTVQLRTATVLPDTVYGVVVLIDFQDVKSDVTKENIERFCNGDNYTEFGNSCSVKEYFQRISGGKLTYLNYVTDFITMPENKDYYDCISDSLWFSLFGSDQGRIDEILEKVSNVIKSGKFAKVKQLTKISSAMVGDEYRLVNILYAGEPECGWSNGLWPHMSPMGISVVGNSYDNPYQISNLGDELTVGTFIHESAHLLCGWPDFYSYDGVETNSNIYGLGTQFISTKTKNPLPPSPLCLDWMGWLNKTDITDLSDGQLVSLKNKIGEAAVYYKKGKRGESDECYYLEVRREHARGYHQEYDLDGLFVWHVNEYGNNQYSSSYFGLQQEDCRPATYYDPCFKKGLKTELNDFTNPSAIWDDGKKSGLDVWDISEAGDTMSFRCGRASDVLTLNELKLPKGFVGQHFSSQLSTISNQSIVENIRYKLIGGELPDGITMGAKGLISGSSTAIGEYSIVVEAFYSEDLRDTAAFTIQILPLEELIKENVAHKVPGIIQAEDFMMGGEGFAYHDLTENNGMGDTVGAYRPDEDVDIFISRELFLNFSTMETEVVENQGVYMERDEWLRYYIDVEESGEYKLCLHYDVLYDQTMRDYQIYLDDSLLVDYEYLVDVTDSFADDYIYDMSMTNFIIHLSKGNHLLKLRAGRDMSLDKIELKNMSPDHVLYDSLPALPGHLCVYDFDIDGIKDRKGNLLEHLNNCKDRVYRPHDMCKHMFDFSFNKEFDFFVDYTVNIEESNWYYISGYLYNSDNYGDRGVFIDGEEALTEVVEQGEFGEDLLVYLPSGKHTLTFNVRFLNYSNLSIITTFIEPLYLYDTISVMVADCYSEGILIMESIINYFPYTVETRGLGADSVNSGLPNGLFLDRVVSPYNPTYDYMLSGTATEVGEFDFEIILRDSIGNSFRDTIHLVVSDWNMSFPKERIVVGEWYYELLPNCALDVETRGIGKDSVNTGLPPGITLNDQLCFFGFPEQVGEYTFELIVRNKFSQTTDPVFKGSEEDGGIIVFRDTITMVVHEKTKPFKDTRVVPCIIEAEDFDLGDEGAAYYLEETFKGEMSEYRTEPIEIVKNDSTYSLVLNSGDWFTYSFEVHKEGLYETNVNYSSRYEYTWIRTEILNEFGSSMPYFDSNVLCDGTILYDLPIGKYYLKITNEDWDEVVIDNIKVSEFFYKNGPFGDIPTIPGKINLLEFDKSGYFDIDCENNGGLFRPDEAVDIYEYDDEYNILIEGYEILKYSVKCNPNSSGKYRVTIPFKTNDWFYEMSGFSLTIESEYGERYLGESGLLYSTDTVCAFDINLPGYIYKSHEPVVLSLKNEGYGEYYIKEMFIEEVHNSVEDIESITFELYPNPSVDYFTINVNNESVSMRIYNSQGSLIEEYFDISNGEFKFGKELSSGVYVVEITSENYTVSKKIVKL